ncbi:MAG: 4Fe-4S dicluster domain-containing protein [Deltaproteobacteria bacterium]
MASETDKVDDSLVSGVEDIQQTRRRFLTVLGAATAVAAETSCTPSAAVPTWEEFVQKHYTELTPEDKRRIFQRIEAETMRTHGVEVHVRDPHALRGVEFGYALNLSVCVGCRRCEYACAAENNTSRDPQIHYIRVMQMEKGSLDVDQSVIGYEGPVPKAGHFYGPVQCHQCRRPPCVRACPVGATWSEPDGVVVVDYNWCIGCRYCIVACPYFARRFNFTEGSIRPSEINPDQGYLSNRLRPRGVVEKCTFCLHRTRRGQYPACVEACPTGARKFGNLRDPQSEVRQIIETKRVFILHEEAGTHPRFFYYFM